MKPVEILVATKKDAEFIESCVVQYIDSQVPPTPITYINRCVKENGEVVGGVLAEIQYKNVLFVDVLWVKEDCRNKGYATALMNDIEKQAIEAGCVLSHVSTYEFQALGLYEKLGYTVFGTMADCPEGYNDYYLWKRLDSTAPTHQADGAQKIEIHDATEDDVDCICDGLGGYNNSKVPFDRYPRRKLDKCIKDGDEIVAGIVMYMYWNAMSIGDLWVKAEYRNKGYATALMNAVEKDARDLGCTLSHLETFSPEMRNLCEKLGYTVYGTMADYPEGHNRYYMSKKLQ